MKWKKIKKRAFAIVLATATALTSGGFGMMRLPITSKAASVTTDNLTVRLYLPDANGNPTEAGEYDITHLILNKKYTVFDIQNMLETYDENDGLEEGDENLFKYGGTPPQKAAGATAIRSDAFHVTGLSGGVFEIGATGDYVSTSGKQMTAGSKTDYILPTGKATGHVVNLYYTGGHKMQPTDHATHKCSVCGKESSYHIYQKFDQGEDVQCLVCGEIHEVGSFSSSPDKVYTGYVEPATCLSQGKKYWYNADNFQGAVQTSQGYTIPSDGKTSQYDILKKLSYEDRNSHDLVVDTKATYTTPGKLKCQEKIMNADGTYTTCDATFPTETYQEDTNSPSISVSKCVTNADWSTKPSITLELTDGESGIYGYKVTKPNGIVKASEIKTARGASRKTVTIEPDMAGEWTVEAYDHDTTDGKGNTTTYKFPVYQVDVTHDKEDVNCTVQSGSHLVIKLDDAKYKLGEFKTLLDQDDNYSSKGYYYNNALVSNYSALFEKMGNSYSASLTAKWSKNIVLCKVKCYYQQKNGYKSSVKDLALEAGTQELRASSFMDEGYEVSDKNDGFDTDAKDVVLSKKISTSMEGEVVAEFYYDRKTYNFTVTGDHLASITLDGKIIEVVDGTASFSAKYLDEVEMIVNPEYGYEFNIPRTTIPVQTNKNTLTFTIPSEDGSIKTTFNPKKFYVSYAYSNKANSQAEKGNVCTFEDVYSLQEASEDNIPAGYHFVGWYVGKPNSEYYIAKDDPEYKQLDLNNRSVVDFDTTDSNLLDTTNGDTRYVIKMFPKYEVNDYKVTLHDTVADATGSAIHATINGYFTGANESGDEINSVAVPKRTGYTFEGYWTYAYGKPVMQFFDADGTPTYYANEDTFSSGKIKEDTHLYAKWRANNYLVRYDGNGATSGHMADSTFEYMASDNILAKNLFTRTGYDFAGWLLPGEEELTEDEAHVGDLATEEGAIVIAKAQWRAKKFEVSFNMSGANLIEGKQPIPATVELSYGGTLTLPSAGSYEYPASDAASIRYFKGWKISGTTYDAGEKIKTESLFNEDGSGKTIEAVWSPLEADADVTVTFLKEKLDGTYEVADQERTTFEKLATVYEKEYEGFARQKEYEATLKNENHSLDISLYYNRKSYAITIESDENIWVQDYADAMNNDKVFSFKYGETVTLKPTTASGWYFGQWLCESGLILSETQATTPELTFEMPARNLTLKLSSSKEYVSPITPQPTEPGETSSPQESTAPSETAAPSNRFSTGSKIRLVWPFKEATSTDPNVCYVNEETGYLVFGKDGRAILTYLLDDGSTSEFTVFVDGVYAYICRGIATDRQPSENTPGGSSVPDDFWKSDPSAYLKENLNVKLVEDMSKVDKITTTNDKVAYIDSEGYVRVGDNGTATITINYKSGATEQYMIVVDGDYVYIGSIKLSDNIYNPSQTQDPSQTPTPNNPSQPGTTTAPGSVATGPVIVGDESSIVIGGITYRLSGTKMMAVKCQTTLKAAVIQKKVTLNGKKYNVVGVKKNTFKKCPKLKKITIKAKNITLYGGSITSCKKLTTINVKAVKKLTVKKGAIKKCKKITVKASKKNKAKVRKAFKKGKVKVTVK